MPRTTSVYGKKSPEKTAVRPLTHGLYLFKFLSIPSCYKIFMNEYEGRKRREELVRGILDNVLAGLAIKLGKFHGYEMMQTVKKELDVNIGPSTIYPALARLEKKGYLNKPEWLMKNGKPRKTYTPDIVRCTELVDELQITASLATGSVTFGVIDQDDMTVSAKNRKTAYSRL